ncbi:MAG: DUF1800 family protein [Solirubrobacteraceae bacterium]
MAKRRKTPSRKKAGDGWSPSHVRRLFWRAGFGATETQAKEWARRGKTATLNHLLDPGPAELRGPEPRIGGRGLDPVNEFGHDKLWWLDRMVRSNRPLEEKMTLFWHDHFATRHQPTPTMLDQNRTLRARGLGSFAELLRVMTFDPGLADFLSLTENVAEAPNENFARELMELFTLGSGYTESDIREASRALTGLRARTNSAGLVTSVYFDEARHDGGRKTVFGQTGAWGPQDILDLCLVHPAHGPFMVSKLWDFFVGTPIGAGVRSRLAAAYVASGLQLRPLVRSILSSRQLYANLVRPDMVKWPAVLVAGQLHAMGAGVRIMDWNWLMASMGQSLFSPPSVAGWEWGPRWLSSNAMRARFGVANAIVREDGPGEVRPQDVRTLKPKFQVSRALHAVGSPQISSYTRRELDGLVREYGREPGLWERHQLQRSLRHLIVAGPDNQLC